MQKFLRGAAFLLLTICYLCSAAAQNAKSAGVTDADVKAFIKNYPVIQKELDKMGVELEDENLAASIKSHAKVEAMLQANGISGPNRVNKLVAICTCFAVAYYDVSMASDPETAAMMKQMGMDPLAEIRLQTNAADSKVVSKYVTQIAALMESESAAEDEIDQSTQNLDMYAFYQEDREPQKPAYRKPSEYTGKFLRELPDEMGGDPTYVREFFPDEAEFVAKVYTKFFESLPQTAGYFTLVKPDIGQLLEVSCEVFYINSKKSRNSFLGKQKMLNFGFQSYSKALAAKGYQYTDLENSNREYQQVMADIYKGKEREDLEEINKKHQEVLSQSLKIGELKIEFTVNDSDGYVYIQKDEMVKPPAGVAYMTRNSSDVTNNIVTYYFGSYKPDPKNKEHYLMSEDRKITKLSHFSFGISGSKENVDIFIKAFNSAAFSKAMLGL